MSVLRNKLVHREQCLLVLQLYGAVLGKETISWVVGFLWLALAASVLSSHQWFDSVIESVFTHEKYVSFVVEVSALEQMKIAKWKPANAGW